jgi:cytochrome c oxidase subunit 4
MAESQPTLHPEHEVKIGTYVLVLFVLIALSLINVALAFAPLGMFHGLFAVSIAALEAFSVILFVMHIDWSSKLMKLTVAAGFFTMLVLVVMTLSDYTSRAWGLW